MPSTWRASLRRGEHVEAFGFFGVGAERYFAGSDRALAYLRGYRAARVGGIAMLFAGAAILAGGIALEISASAGTQFSTPRLIGSFGLILASVPMFALGPSLQDVAAMSLSRAVAAYNEDVILRELR
jgi:hypothetical protein